MNIRVLVACAALLLAGTSSVIAAEMPLRILFLGDDGPHQPASRYRLLQPVLSKKSIELVYTDRASDLNRERLSDFHGVLIYANLTSITPEQEQALIDYVASGHGLIPVHSASFCFQNSDRYIDLVGGQFQSHGTGVFRVAQADVEHPILKDFQSFESWDESYRHTKHQPRNRTVLEYRVDEPGRNGVLTSVRSNEQPDGEPWTWVRTEGEGRVFYTAWGHDDRTWSHPGFHNLIERGIRWACKQDPTQAGPYRDRPEMTQPDPTAKPFETMAGRLPNYPAGERHGTTTDPINQMQKPVPAEESIRHMSTPVGFRPELVATEPAIGKPLSMNWDERGRLWLLETVDYPNELKPSGQGRDRIRICEDTDGDGKADRFTIFAENLSIPTSLAFAYGGVIVHQVPDTLFLRDSNGDDVADERHVLFTGWKTWDTHAGPSHLNYGLDGWYYGMVGYSGFEGTIAGQPQKFQTGFYRFRLDPPAGPKLPPVVTAFEFLRNTNNNSWGIGLSEEGVLFGSTANGNPSEYMPIANRYYERVRGWSSTVLGGIALDNAFDPITPSVRQVDWHGGFTAAAGHALYTARHYPPEYWNRTAFVTEPTGHLIATFTLQPSGAGYRSRNSWNLMASRDEWTAPVAAEVGPDGQVWFIDWYNIIVQHNPTPAGFENGPGNAYVTDLRDKTHGRVYRLKWIGDDPANRSETPVPAERLEPLSLGNASREQLLAALSHTGFFWRRHAQRVLMEQPDAGLIEPLQNLVRTSQPLEGEANPVAAMHAVWILAELEQRTGQKLDRTFVHEVLRSPYPGLRRNAVLALQSTVDELQKCRLHEDPDGQVRLAALLRLADLAPSSTAAELVASALNDPVIAEDRWLSDALTSALAVHGHEWLRLMANAGNGRPSHAAILPRLRILGEHLGRSDDPSIATDLVRALPVLSPDSRGFLADGFNRGWKPGKPVALSDQDQLALVNAFEQSPADLRPTLLRLDLKLGTRCLDSHLEALTNSMLSIVRDESSEDERRSVTARELIELQPQNPVTANQLLEVLTPALSPIVSDGVIQALGKSEAEGLFARLINHLAGLTPAQRNSVVRVLLSRTDGVVPLLEAVSQKQVSLAELTLDQKQFLMDHPRKEVSERARELLSKAGGLPNPDRQKVIDEFLPVTQIKGEPAKGKIVFREQCSKCHQHSGEGTRIGPDLTGMAVHPKHELLIHILDPGRSVEGNYRAYTVATVDGLVVNGLLASESRTTLEFFDGEGKRRVVQRSDIEQFVASDKSLMPEGFEKQIPRESLVDLLEFLAQRGKYLPLPLDKVATAVSTRGMFTRTDADAERLIFSDWTPKTFSGVPFHLVDPQGDRQKNVILLHGPATSMTRQMPTRVSVPCQASARAIHLLSGVSGWGSPFGEVGSVSVIVRLKYADGSTEEHPLKNGQHFADYIRRVDVPESQFAFALRNQQIRYLSITPKQSGIISEIEFVKGPDGSAPVVMSVTVETAEPH